MVYFQIHIQDCDWYVGREERYCQRLSLVNFEYADHRTKRVYFAPNFLSHYRRRCILRVMEKFAKPLASSTLLLVAWRSGLFPTRHFSLLVSRLFDIE